MYAVVGCGDCGAVWIVEGRPETTGCSRCGTRHRFDRLRRFAETDDLNRARQARAERLAERSGHRDALADLGSYAELDTSLDGARPTDEDLLGALGVDPAAVTAAGEDAMSSRRGNDRPRREIVASALSDLDAPTLDAVVDYAADRGVPPEAARRLLERMVSTGEATRDGGRYRLL